MEVLAYIVLAFTALQLIVVLINFIFPQSLDLGIEEEVLVSVLVPARNEEKRIGLLLEDLKNQDYSKLEIIVFDDESTDNTAEVVNSYALLDKRISMIRSEGLKQGWLGKNWACYNLAQQAKGSYLLFLDADVRIEGNIIGQAMRKAVKGKLGLLSIFPQQILQTRGEKMTVPVMHYILLSLLPLILVRKSSFVSLSAANGQFMLFEKGIYNTYQPHKELKAERVEDIATMRLMKNNHVAVACLAVTKGLSCRMYGGFSEAIHGFSKNILLFFGNSAILAFAFWLVTTLGFIPVVLFASPAVIAVYLATVVLIRILVSLTAGQSTIENLLYLIPQQIAIGLMIMGALRHSFQKNYLWKDRNIS